MIDEFHVMYMYKEIQAEPATTDIKTLEQHLKKFKSVVNERRVEYKTTKNVIDICSKFQSGNLSKKYIPD